MITTSDFKRGVQFEWEGEPYTIIDVETRTPSARGAATLVTVKARNAISGQLLQKTWKSGEKFKEPDLEKKKVQYLYPESDGFVFMDMENYEQFSLGEDFLGDGAKFLTEILELLALVFNSKVVGVELPQFVTLKVTDVAPGARGDTASGVVTTPATTEGGLTIQVPLFVRNGDKIRVDTRTGDFKDRV